MEPQSLVLPHMETEVEDPWDLTSLLDFNLDDEIPISFDLDKNSQLPLPESLDLPSNSNLQLHLPEIPTNDKVRKRDPRLACSNFLAGRVPCACPEMDAKLEEEENSLPGKKRARSARASASARCQVPGCEADITELKGYHRRHKVCLRCANATTVLLHGESKRYCQQCGKFHVLSDFDEGKRSCRRKLEWHNTRRRRKPANSRSAADRERQSVTQNDDSNYDGEARQDSSNLSSGINEKGASSDHEDEPVAILCSAPDSQNINNDGVVSFVASGETQVNSGKDVSNISNSPSYCDNKSAYSSMCQTGRISFKLYDWNPAEFPRRLRHQIFQWLASMPIELEGYIRPGCTILTIFIAMPKIMWINLLKDPRCYVCDLVAPGKMLSGRGTILVHLNDMIYQVTKDGTSVMKVEVNMQAPRLQYVHPTCFEAGKPMEFVACGRNLLQPKFRLLVSFSGKYLKYEYCVPSPHNSNGDNISCAFDNQLYKIYVPHTEESLFGPAFIEVENESGLSNFIPVLIGDKEICAEMKMLQQKLDVSLLSKQFQSASGGSICSSCEAFALRHTLSSDLLVDIAWLLKDPTSENFDRVMTDSQIQRYCYLLDFLICNDSTIILGKILPNLIVLTESMKSDIVINRTSDVDMTPLLKCMHNARDAMYQKHQKGGGSILHSEMDGVKLTRSCSHDNMSSVVAVNSQGTLSRADLKLLTSPTSNDKNERIPLLKREIIMNVEELPKRCDRRYLARGFLSSQRPAIFVIVSVAVCLGVCVAVLHHGRVSELAVSIRRCLFNY
ncbi:squamosa promoter-binding-like protein 7 [Gastrolobium bilobum]|uniref:squamosa promoter-binding-like protein 7 n=1 Tax=Gastrolobium bilobum TaxID=150636 RepID=UPI002AB1738E|nr:squamosa promoter-binding-like protein 7 [Gastrolobium bilobum]